MGLGGTEESFGAGYCIGMVWYRIRGIVQYRYICLHASLMHKYAVCMHERGTVESGMLCLRETEPTGRQDQAF
jgi:hypothetical protein